MNKKTLSLILLGLPIALTVIFSLILQATVLVNPEKFTSWLSSFGVFVILIYALIQPLTIIIAPIGGFFMYIAVMAIFKPFYGLILVYLVTTPIYCVNFYLAKRFGRPLVQKLIGKAGIAKIDHIAKDLGTTTLIILKVFQGSYFDYISYAVGLTQIPFKTFVIVNFLGGVPSILISYFVLTRFENFTLGILAVLVVSYTMIGVSFILHHIVKKHKQKLL